MTKDVQTGWLHNKEDGLFAPKTLMDSVQDTNGISLKEYIKTHGGSGGSSLGLNIEEIFKANSSDEMISEGGTITLPKNYDEYDQIVLGIGTKGDGFDYGLD